MSSFWSRFYDRDFNSVRMVLNVGTSSKRVFWNSWEFIFKSDIWCILKRYIIILTTVFVITLFIVVSINIFDGSGQLSVLPSSLNLEFQFNEFLVKEFPFSVF